MAPLFSLFTAATLLAGASATLDPIVIKGSKFYFSSNGTQFFIKGVAYQSGIGANGATVSSSETALGYIDPLADSTSCARDIPYLKKLGANTIRTYALDPTADHSKCMALLDAAGIYVISDLGEPNLSINRDTPSWNTELYARYTSVVNSMSAYTNTIGFFAGNEVSNAFNVTNASAFVKAAVRDTKAYIKSNSTRPMYVGYAADDDATVRSQVAAYFNCGDLSTQIDFWGYNIYEWCGDSDFQTSGYADRVKEFTGYSVPAFFAEYGCNTQGGGAAGRKFTEVAALYGDQMTPVFSGGFVYEYFQEENDYGLAKVSGSSVSTLADFGAFSSQIHAVAPSGTPSASYNPTNTAGQACPTLDAKWAASSKLPPTPNTAACSCMMSSLTCTLNTKNVNDTAIGDLFSTVCGLNGGKGCVNIAANATTGVYGLYSMCSPQEQLANAFDTYYKALDSAADACGFNGAAQLVKPKAAASTCSSVLAAASSANPTSTKGASSSKAAAGTLTPSATLGMGKWFFGAYTLVALGCGAGMILL